MDIRSVLPSQLIAESGSDIVVINFGSASLRINVATRQSPVVVPHCIAHRLLVPHEEVAGDKLRKKGSVPEQGVPLGFVLSYWQVSKNPISSARSAERDEICQMVELQLKMKPFLSDQESSTKVDGDGWANIQLDDEESFQWTQVMMEKVLESDVPAVEPMVITNSHEDSHHLASQTHVTEVSEIGSQEDHELKVMEEMVEESVREIQEESEQASVEKLKEDAGTTRDEEIVEDSEEETLKEPEKMLVEDSEEETQKEPEKVIVQDSEEEIQKESLEFVEDSEEETLKEREERIQDVHYQGTPKESAQESHHEPESEVHDVSDMELHVEVPLEPEDSLISEGQARVKNPVENPFKYRHHVCGEEALNIAVSEPFFLRRPFCRGHLNVTQHYSLQQVCDDIYSIWDWVLTEKLSMDARTREQFSVVLVVPDTLDNREIKELLSIVLRDLHFRSAVVHQESVAATFGNGTSSACVVNMGAQVTSIVCVEDGVVLPTTRIVLPFGGEDISRCLFWVQKRWQTWPPISTDPLNDPLDLLILERIKESYCLIIEGEQRAVVEIPYHEAGRPTLVYKGSLLALNPGEGKEYEAAHGALLLTLIGGSKGKSLACSFRMQPSGVAYNSLNDVWVPVMGLFYPSLLAPEEYAAPPRPGFHIDHEDGLDDSFHFEPSRKSDITEVVLPPGSNGVLMVPGTAEVGADDTAGSEEPGLEESALGLSRAIVNSILSTGRPDLQKKLFASIQLVGGTAYTRGLVDAVEERVLHDIPADEAVDTVAVLQNRTEAPIACWKGGAVLGILDFSRDAWVHHDDWVTGGVRIGYGRKYKDSYTLHSQAFYYSAAVE